MSLKTAEDRISFINSLALSEPTSEMMKAKTEKATYSDDDEAGYVDSGSLVSFVAGVSALHKSDALNSTLLAQLAANKKYDREKQTEDWYKYYREVLENVGWVIQQFDFTKFSASGTTFSVDEVVADVLEAIGSDEDKSVVDETIKAVKALSDGDGRLVIWDQNSTSLDKGNFQISACAESDGVLVMKIGAFYFSTNETVTQVLWFSFSSSDTSFYKGAQTINLNEDVYSQVRQTVIDKLGQNAQDFVGNLDI